MRTLIASLAVLLLVGCASQHPQAVATSNSAAGDVVYTDRPGQAPATAPALVFDPVVTNRIPQLDFDREDRQASAYVGYEEGVVTSFYIRTDDRQLVYPSAGCFNNGNCGSSGSGNQGYLDREAISETSGLRYR